MEEQLKNTPSVEYSLTDLCQELLPALKIINEWGKKLLPTFPIK